MIKKSLLSQTAKIAVAALVISSACNITANASEMVKSPSNTKMESNIDSRAISGSKTQTINGYGEFSITSKGWSALGHIKVSVSGASSSNNVVVIIEGPDGNVIVGEAMGLFQKNETRYHNLGLAKAGRYTVKVQTTSGNATVSVSLHDWLAS